MPGSRRLVPPRAPEGLTGLVQAPLSSSLKALVAKYRGIMRGLTIEPLRALGIGALAAAALTACALQPAAAPPATVTVTAIPSPERAGPNGSDASSGPSPGASPSKATSEGEVRFPAFGVIVSNAEQLCTTPIDTMPDLVNDGDSPEFTRALQLAAFTLGFDAETDGRYDTQTVKIVKQIQTTIGVVPDGQVGPITWGAFRDYYCPDYQEYFSGSDAPDVAPSTPTPSSETADPAAELQSTCSALARAWDTTCLGSISSAWPCDNPNSFGYGLDRRVYQCIFSPGKFSGRWLPY